MRIVLNVFMSSSFRKKNRFSSSLFNSRYCFGSHFNIPSCFRMYISIFNTLIMKTYVNLNYLCNSVYIMSDMFFLETFKTYTCRIMMQFMQYIFVETIVKKNKL